MTVTGGGSADEPTRVDREPPSFPSVSEDSASNSTETSGAPIFSTAAAANPSDPPAPRASRGSRLRWVVAAIATLVVLAIVGGVLVVAAPRPGTPSPLAHYVPADTGMYAEIRLDLPGDQHANLASFMSHFPGFADQASFQQKLDESLNSLLTNKTNGKIDWNNDIKPWFGGQIAVFGNPSTGSPAPCIDTQNMAASSCATNNAPSNGVFALLVSDKAKLQATIDANVGSSQVSSTDYQGFQIKTIAQPAGTSTAASYVVTDDAVLIAPTPELLEEALGVKAAKNGSLADQSFFLQQLGELHADRLATFYFDGNQQTTAAPLASSGVLPAQCTQAFAGMGNRRAVGEVRAESDHLAFTVRTETPSGDNAPPVPTNGQTTLAQAMPANTVLYVEMHGAGATGGWLINQLLSCAPTTSGGVAPGGMDIGQAFQQFLGAKPEDYLNFVQNAALGVTYGQDQVSAGLVATVDDEATANARVAKIVSLAKLMGGGFGGASSGMSITTDETDHNGAKVTTITVASGMESNQAPVSIQVAVANGRLYLGYGTFVVDSLDRQASDSLASSAKYQKAIAAGPSDNAGIVYVDVAQAAELAEERMSPDEKAKFEANQKPFVDALSSLSMVAHADAGMLVINGFLYVE